MADMFMPTPLPAVNSSAMGGMMPFISPDQIAQNQTDMLQWQQKQALAQQLMQSQYMPNTGRAGVAGTILERVMGALGQNQNNQKLSDILKQQFQIENQAAQAKRAQDLEDEHRKMLEEIQKGVTIARGTAQAGKEFAPDKIENGLRIGADGQVAAIPGWNDAAVALAKQKAAIDAANRQGPADPFQSIKTAVSQGVITPEEAQKRMHDVALGLDKSGSDASQWQVVGNNRVNKVTGEVQPLMGPNGKPIPAGADAKSNAAMQGAQKNLATQVLNYVSTATGTPMDDLQKMSPQEVADHFKAKGGRSAITAMGAYTGLNGVVNPNLDAFATAAQAQEARIQHPVGNIPFNAETLARKSSLGPEKTDLFNSKFIKSALEDASKIESGSSAPAPVSAAGKTILRTGTDAKTGQKVVQYSDGSIGPAQ